VAQKLGLTQGEQIIGFLYLGTPARELREAPALATADFVQAWG
jgi:hypothetical protein